MLSIPLLLLRTALLALSFFGLCAAARKTLNLDRFSSPLFTACAIICVLMLSGMLRILKYGFGALYCGGLIYCVCQLVKRRGQAHSLRLTNIDRTAIITSIAFAAYLVYRLWSCRLYLPDDLAHWGVATKYLLANDALPDASAAAITFSSYPTGAAAFIYYVCRTLGSSEALWMIAQNMLMLLFFLPVLAHVGKESKSVLSLIPVALLVLFKFDRPLTTLCVDWLLSFLGFGTAAAILHSRNDPRRAMLIAVPAAIAAVYIKSSGFFFAACIALMVIPTCKTRRSRILCPIIVLSAAAAAYLLWTWHISISYPAALESKHAVSLSAYAHELSSKSSALILLILKKMLLTWLRPSGSQIFTMACAALAMICMWTALRSDKASKTLRRETMQLVVFSAAVYAAWFVMLFAMYVFSMPEGEARNLAAYPRYNSTGLVFVLGVMLIALLRVFSDDQLAAKNHWTKYVCAGMCAVSLAAAPLLMLDMPEFTLYPFYYDLTRHDTAETEYRRLPKALIERSEISGGGRYLICCGTVEDPNSIIETYYHSRFELDTANLTILARIAGNDDSWMAKSLDHRVDFTSPADYLAESMDDFDAVLIYREDEAFDASLNAFLQTYSGNTPVIHAY